MVDTLIQTMNVPQTIYEIPRSMGGLFEQNPIGIEQDVNEQIMNAYAQAFDPDTLIKIVKRTLADHYNPDYADTVWHWSQQDSIKKILQLEEEFNTIQGYRKQVIGKYELDQNPPTEIRLMLIESLRDATSATNLAVDSYSMIFKGFLSSINKLSPTRNFSDAQMESFVDNYRAQMNDELSNEILNQYLVMYHDVSYDAISNYIDFFETGSGTWINSTLQDGIKKAYRDAILKFNSGLNTADTTTMPNSNDTKQQ